MQPLLATALLVLSTGVAAPQSDRDALVGVWRFDREVDTYADGTPVPGPPIECDGILVYTSDGFMSVLILPKGRTWSADRAAPAELRATVDSGSAYAGRFEIDATRHSVTHLLEVSLAPAYKGERLTRGYVLDGDELKLTGSFEDRRKTVHFTISWVRSSRAPQSRLIPAAMEVQARVERTLGTRPVECGRFLITKSGRPAASAAELRKAVSCVTNHAASGTPAWMLQQLRGIDSWVARGLMTGRDGRVQMFSFDDDPSGGGSADPSFTASNCGLPSVGGGTIRCRDDRSRQDLLQAR